MSAPLAQGLIPVWINRASGKFQGRELLTVGAMADSYHEYLLKTWLYTRKQARTLFLLASAPSCHNGTFCSSRSAECRRPALQAGPAA